MYHVWVSHIQSHILISIISVIWTLLDGICRFFSSAVYFVTIARSSQTEVFLVKGVPKICCKFTRKHPCWRDGCSHFGMGVLLQIQSIFSEHLLLRTPLNTSELHISIYHINKTSVFYLSFMKMSFKIYRWRNTKFL